VISLKKPLKERKPFMVTKYNLEVVLVTNYVVEITQKRVCEENSAPDFSTDVSFVFAE